MNKVKVNVRLSNSRSWEAKTHEQIFDNAEAASLWIDKHGLQLDSQCGNGYSDSEGEWAIDDGCLWSEKNDGPNHAGWGASVMDQAYCYIDRLVCLEEFPDDALAIKESEIRNQLAIAQTRKANEDWYDNEDKWALLGYIHALLYVLGELKPKFNKEDI